MSENGLKVGDVVRLKSGGPNMTVAKVYDANLSGLGQECECAWFFGVVPEAQDLKTGDFAFAALEKVEGC